MTRWLSMFGTLERAVLLLAALAIVLGIHLMHQPLGPSPAGPASVLHEAGAVVGLGERAAGNGLQAALPALRRGSAHLVHAGSATQVQSELPAAGPPPLAPTARLVTLDRQVQPGGSINVAMEVGNPNDRSIIVGLGMSLVPTDGRSMFSDVAHDLVHSTVPPGQTELRRVFVVPAGTPPGQYGAWLAVYDATFPKHPPDRVYSDFGMFTYLVTVR